MHKTGSYTVGLAGQAITLNAFGSAADDMIRFLCCDLFLEGAESPTPHIEYDLMVSGANATWSLWVGEDDIYTGTSRYDLAFTLIDEVIRQCIYDNSTGYAIHAAAISIANGGVLLPGISGSGKSTLTTWLVAQGADYLTDELVMLTDSDFHMSPFTRPLSIKAGSVDIVSSFLNVDLTKGITGRNGIMLPHRLVNPNFRVTMPPLALVLFPRYEAGAGSQIVPVTPAAGCARLVECFVNARNMPGHGIAYMAQLARTVPMHELVYSSFDGLQELLKKTFPEFFMRDT